MQVCACFPNLAVLYFRFHSQILSALFVFTRKMKTEKNTRKKGGGDNIIYMFSVPRSLQYWSHPVLCVCLLCRARALRALALSPSFYFCLHSSSFVCSTSSVSLFLSLLYKIVRFCFCFNVCAAWAQEVPGSQNTRVQYFRGVGKFENL